MGSHCLCRKGLISVSPFDTVKLLTTPDSGIFGVLLISLFFFSLSLIPVEVYSPDFFPVLPTSVFPVLWVFGFGNSSAVAPVYSNAHSKLRSHYSTDRHSWVESAWEVLVFLCVQMFTTCLEQDVLFWNDQETRCFVFEYHPHIQGH